MPNVNTPSPVLDRTLNMLTFLKFYLGEGKGHGMVPMERACHK